MKFNLKIYHISKIFYLLFIFIASIVLYPNLSSSNTNGSIGGKTGSPKDDISCLQCHNATNGNQLQSAKHNELGLILIRRSQLAKWLLKAQ